MDKEIVSKTFGEHGKILKDVQINGEVISERVDRQEISEESKNNFRNASSAEEKANILFEIITGEQP